MPIRVVIRIVSTKSKWKGFNTDVAGFLKPLQQRNPDISEVVLLGAGGAARAVMYGLTQYGAAQIRLVVRDTEKGRLLRQDFPELAVSVHPFSKAGRLLKDCDLLINSTPLGTWPEVSATPLADLSGLKPGSMVYDLVYNPEVTRLQQDARNLNRGIVCIGGLEMLLGQAEEAFRLWTGRDLPIEVVRKAIAGGQ